MASASNDLEDLSLPINGFTFSAIAAGPATGELVLFLHGFPQFADAWAGLMRAVANAGFRTVAVDQRGYSPAARPAGVAEYAIEHLVADILGFSDALGVERFHLVGHDWGGLLAWKVAAEHPERLKSVTVLSTPHPNAFLHALQKDADQKARSKYIVLFRLPGHVAEGLFALDRYHRLRNAYQGKISEAAIEENLRRLREPGALTAALNWYRALDLKTQTKNVPVPTLYIWGSDDMALGETAALATASYVTGRYQFVRLEGKSHWLIEEVPDDIVPHLLAHIRST